VSDKIPVAFEEALVRGLLGVAGECLVNILSFCGYMWGIIYLMRWMYPEG